MQENIKSLIFVKFILSYRYTFDFDRYSVEIWSFKLCCLLFENRRREKEKKKHLIYIWSDGKLLRLIPFSRPRCSYPKCRRTVFHTFRFNLTTRSDSQDEVNDRQGGSTWPFARRITVGVKRGLCPSVTGVNARTTYLPPPLFTSTELFKFPGPAN